MRLRTLIAATAGVALLLHAKYRRQVDWTPRAALDRAVAVGDWATAYGIAADFDDEVFGYGEKSPVVSIDEVMDKVVSEFPGIPAADLRAAIDRYEALVAWGVANRPSEPDAVALNQSTSTPRDALAIWPVIHLDTVKLAVENAAIAAAHGCAGVFLISMDGRDHLIEEAAPWIRAAQPSLALGANYLTLTATAALDRSLRAGLDATWCDAPGIRSECIRSTMTDHLESVLRTRPEHLFFGSVAFKYQPVEPDPPAAARVAAERGMISTTSGEATGHAPPIAKLSAMRAETAQLALASGATPDNIVELGRHLTHVLVSTGISKSFHEFDSDKLRLLVDRSRTID